MTLSSAPGDAEHPQVALDDHGNSLVAWRQHDGAISRIDAVARSVSGTVTALPTLSGSGKDADSPGVAVAGVGAAAFVWTEFSDVESRVRGVLRTTTGALGAVASLSAAGSDANTPRVAIDQNGNAVFVWVQVAGDGQFDQVLARTLSPSGAAGPVLSISDAGANAEQPDVAVNAQGDAVFTWLRYDGSNLRVQARRLARSGALGPVVTISNRGEQADAPHVALAPRGHAFLIWARSDFGPNPIQTGFLSTTETPPEIQALLKSGNPIDDPQVAVGQRGASAVSWASKSDLNSPFQVQAKVSSSGAVRDHRVRKLSDPGQEAREPCVGVDAQGDAVFAWRRDDGLNFRIQARTRSAAAAHGALSPAQTLSDAGQHAREPRLAVGPDGSAIIAWSRSDGKSSRIQAVVGP